MSNQKNCEDGSEVSFWSAIKSTFKMIGCGVNAAGNTAEAIESLSCKWSEEVCQSLSLFRLENLDITNADGSLVEDPVVAGLILEFDKGSIKDMVAIAEVYDLDISKYLERRIKLEEFDRIRDLT
jgi:hypothetical protein